MRAAYLDTSFLLAILFGERPARALARTLDRFDQVFAGDMLVAEVVASAVREGIDPLTLLSALDRIALILPDRSLEPEIREVAESGYLRGADLWHVACALFLAGAARSELTFLSRDAAQRTVARKLGFAAP